jgi:hypothetical protein
MDRHSRRITLLVSTLGAVAWLCALSAKPFAAQAVGTAFTYQGRLTDGGSPATGAYDFSFSLYDASTVGTRVGPIVLKNRVSVVAGLFSVELDFGAAVFSGDARWLEIATRPGGSGGSYSILSPRQSLTPTPYSICTLSVKAPLMLKVNMPASPTPSSPTAIISGINTNAVVGASSVTVGVYGESNSTPDVIMGISAGVYGRDKSNLGGSSAHVGVRAESGNVAGLWKPCGPVGVYAAAEGRGIFGSSRAGDGVSGASIGAFGVSGETDRTDHNYGLFTSDNLYSSNYHLAGAIMQIAQNGGADALESGDVVGFVGMSMPSKEGEAAVPKVAKLASPNSPAVAGVVASRYNMEVLTSHKTEKKTLEDGTEIRTDHGRQERLVVTPDGPVPPGGFLLLVVHGPCRVKAVAAAPIQPGDLLSTAGYAGCAAKAIEMDIGGAKMAMPGAILGKTLEPLVSKQGTIWVFVTLH